MKYQTYPVTLDEIERKVKPGGDSLGDYIRYVDHHMLTTMGLRFLNTIDSQIMAREHNWVKRGREFIFIDSQATIDRLMDLKFKPGKASNFLMPYPTFSLALPKGAQVNGMKLRPALLTYQDLHTGEMVRRLVEDQGLQDMAEGFLNTGETLLSIVTTDKDPQSPGRDSLSITSEDLAKILSIDDVTDVDAFREVIGVLPESRAGLDDEDAIHMAYQLRLVAAMVVYNQVTDGKYLYDGVPQGLGQKPKMFGVQKADHKRNTYHRFNLPAGSAPRNRDGVTEHVRTGHMRNLVDERYYQGEYANLPRGSRWVEVKDSLIGKGTPHTQTSQNS